MHIALPEQPTKDLRLPLRRITPAEGGHYFFGYYDIPAWSPDGAYHLAHRVPFCDRLQAAGDVAELGVITLATGEFTPLTTTTAWCFQQGAMLQWLPGEADTIIYNCLVDGQYRSAIRNIRTGAERLLPLPVATVDPSGRWALSINFSRMFNFRPGYGYAEVPDPFFDVQQPEEDGIFLLDLKTGACEQILSLRQVAEARLEPVAGAKLLINHINFNTDGTRFTFLSRNFTDDTHGWQTAIFTANRDGSELYLLQDYGYASHYHWRDADHLLCHSDGGHTGQPGDLYLFTDRTQQVATIDSAFFTFDGHCSYSPNRRWMLYDSYPIANYRRLYIYDLERRQAHTLGALYAPPEIMAISTDIRSDLHPRWSPDGRQISLDSLHEGFRGVYVMDVGEIVDSPQTSR